MLTRMSKSGMSQFLITFEYDARNSDTDNGTSLSAFDGICARVSRQKASIPVHWQLTKTLKDATSILYGKLHIPLFFWHCHWAPSSLDDSFVRNDLRQLLVDTTLSSPISPRTSSLKNDDSSGSGVDDTDEQEAPSRREFVWARTGAEPDLQTVSITLREIQQQFKKAIYWRNASCGVSRPRIVSLQFLIAALTWKRRSFWDLRWQRVQSWWLRIPLFTRFALFVVNEWNAQGYEHWFSLSFLLWAHTFLLSSLQHGWLEQCNFCSPSILMTSLTAVIAKSEMDPGVSGAWSVWIAQAKWVSNIWGSMDSLSNLL
jgi:hypothetical protein